MTNVNCCIVSFAKAFQFIPEILPQMTNPNCSGPREFKALSPQIDIASHCAPLMGSVEIEGISPERTGGTQASTEQQ